LPAVTGPDPPISCVLALALATVLLAGCGSSSSTKTASTPATSASSAATTPQTTASTATTARSGCQAATAPQPRGPQHLAAPTQRLAPARTYVVTLSTNCGSIKIQLDVKRAPKTSASFASLVKRRFYDGLTFHRIAAGFVIQGGDPSGDGSGGPGYTVVEKPPANLNYTPGTVAMAKSATEPDGASGSQFFIVTGTASALPPQYALVGRVVGGMAAVKAIAAIPSNPPQDGAPTSPVVIRRAVLSTR
jgi:cyclophilin family peptidyl-prolyl cis-trans isomerase